MASSKTMSPELDEFLATFNLPRAFEGLRVAGSHAIKDWRKLTPNALEGKWTRPLVALREFAMMKVVDTITDKPDWHKKVFDREIEWKWRAEIRENKTLDVSEVMFDFIMDELEYKAEVFEKTGATVTYDAGVVKSDSVIPESLKLELRAAAARLEDVPEDKKDWHPGSNQQVLDLVHPSLYPLVYGKSRVVPGPPISVDEALSRAGEGEVLPAVEREEAPLGHTWYGEKKHSQYSNTFQWLPCEVAIKSQEGLEEEEKECPGPYRCEISSYINNLHPRDHHELYGVIQRIMTRTLPLWNMTLSSVRGRPTKVRIPIYGPTCFWGNPKPEKGDDEDPEKYAERVRMWHASRMPEPSWGSRLSGMVSMFGGGEIGDVQGESEAAQVVNLGKDYGGIQVIVKLANIHLTPEKFEYPGGTWHVEGQLNERICATALYYYDSENISESRLAFRQLSNPESYDFEYEQNDNDWLEVYTGVSNYSPGIQEVGSIECKEGRLLTFPNIFMHKVLPFTLADATKPGHRKILALFLVDPEVKVLSSAYVPPQRRDWWEQEVDWQKVMNRLPVELQIMIDEKREGGVPFSEGEAKEMRERLMDERKVFVRENDMSWERSEPFSLCEH